MYLSRLIIKNYRSIQSLDLRFEKGKNVIVGRNNAGKSNIVKAIDLVLGEASPSYEKSENITNNDFYNGDTSSEIYIFCELTRDKDEELNYEEIYKCFGLKVYSEAEVSVWETVNGKRKPIKNLIRVNLDSNAPNTFFEQLKDIFDIVEDNNYVYVDPKLRNQQSFEKQFRDKYKFAFAFQAYKDANGIIHKSIRFLYREDDSEDWFLAFSAPIRSELLQSAIIPSFRDPQIQLRISNWSWYGKLLKKYIDVDNEKLHKAFKEVKDASDEVFITLQKTINDSKINVAFPNTTISFQFNPDSKQDIYKSALIYVNDGFNSQLGEKGSGIQSAVIIGLFDYYTREIATSGCCLLVVEEPELYLHPHGRRVISNRLDDFLEGGKNQVIITTHSSEFITTASHQDLNIIVVKKDFENGTTAVNTSFKNPKERRVLLKSQNTEMFFADFVILTEGADKYILETISKHFGEKIKSTLGYGWLNDFNISILAVGGKGEFAKYVKKLNEVNIPWFVLSDFDFFRRCLNEFLTELNYSKELISKLNGLKGKVGQKVKGDYKNLSEITDPSLQGEVESFLTELKKENIFILKGELEDYYTDFAVKELSGIDGKESRAIALSAEADTLDIDLSKFIKPEEYYEFFTLIKDKLPVVNKEIVVKKETIIEEIITVPVEERIEEIDDIPF